MRFSRLHQCNRQGGRNGAGLPQWADIQIWIIPNGGLHEGEHAFVFQASINVAR